MGFVWDDDKATINLSKHGVSFSLACSVWDDPLYVVLPDRVTDGEQRWHAIGMVGAIVVLVVIHTCADLDNEESIRIIGARRATSRERKRYEQESD